MSGNGRKMRKGDGSMRRKGESCFEIAVPDWHAPLSERGHAVVEIKPGIAFRSFHCSQ